MMSNLKGEADCKAAGRRRINDCGERILIYIYVAKYSQIVLDS